HGARARRSNAVAPRPARRTRQDRPRGTNLHRVRRHPLAGHPLACWPAPPVRRDRQRPALAHGRTSQAGEVAQGSARHHNSVLPPAVCHRKPTLPMPEPAVATPELIDAFLPQYRENDATFKRELQHIKKWRKRQKEVRAKAWARVEATRLKLMGEANKK